MHAEPLIADRGEFIDALTLLHKGRVMVRGAEPDHLPPAARHPDGDDRDGGGGGRAGGLKLAGAASYTFSR